MQMARKLAPFGVVVYPACGIFFGCPRGRQNLTFNGIIDREWTPVAAVAQLVEHSVVVRVVAGSSPVGRPSLRPCGASPGEPRTIRRRLSGEAEGVDGLF